MSKVVKIQDHKAKNIPKADAVLTPMYSKLANLELEVKLLRGEIMKKERELLPDDERAHRQLMRRASKLDW